MKVDRRISFLWEIEVQAKERREGVDIVLGVKQTLAVQKVPLHVKLKRLTYNTKGT